MIAYPVYRHVYSCYNIPYRYTARLLSFTFIRFVCYLPALFVPPAEDTHAKRSEGKRIVWEVFVLSTLEKLCGWQSATGTLNCHPRSLNFSLHTFAFVWTFV